MFPSGRTPLVRGRRINSGAGTAKDSYRSNNTGGVTYSNNTETGSVTITNNSGGFHYTGNKASGTVTVNSNT